MRICEHPATFTIDEKLAENGRHVVDMERIADGDDDTAGHDSIGENNDTAGNDRTRKSDDTAGDDSKKVNDETAGDDSISER